MQLDAAGTRSRDHRTFRRVSDTPAEMPAPDASAPPPRIQIQYPRRPSTAGATPPSARSATPSTVSADVFRDGHEKLRAVVRYRGAGRRRWLEARAACARRAPQRRALGGRVRRRPPGRWEFTIEAWTDLFATWRDELGASSRPASRTSPASCPRASCCSSDARARPRAPTARRSSTRSSVLERRRDPRGRQARRRARPRAARRRRAQRRAPRRDDARAAAAARGRPRARRASAPGTSCSRARGAAFAGVEEQLPRLAELGFDVLYLPPIHPIGAHEPQGPQQHARRRPRRPRLALRDRRREGGHDAVHPELGTIDDVDALVRRGARARHGRRARLRDQRVGRPPVADRAPRVVPPPPRRHAQVRREPAQEVPGHLQRQLGHVRGLARAVGGVARIVLFWVDAAA